MTILYYQVIFVISLFLILGLIVQWRGQMYIAYPILFALIPVINFGYLVLAESTELETAIFANKITYIGGCFFQLLYLLSVYSLCKIKLPVKVLFLLFSLSICLYGCVLTIGHHPVFYRQVQLVRHHGVSTLEKTYGPAHIFFYLAVIGYLLANLAGLIYSILKRPDVSLRNLSLLVGADILCIVAFFGGRAITKEVELMPLFYVLVEIIFLMLGYRLRLYNISGGIVDNVLEQGADGLVCFDFKRRLLVFNHTAGRMFPAIARAKVDYGLDLSVPVFQKWMEGLEQFENDEKKAVFSFAHDDKIYDARVEFIRDGKQKCGYYILFFDVTTERQYIESINRYNVQMKEAAEAAIAADNAKSEFLARMSHEIRTPINAILGMNEMILHKSDDPVILNYANNIEQAGGTLMFLINSILDFSKIEDGRMEIVEAEYSTKNYIQHLKLFVEERAKAKGLSFILNIDETLPEKLYGDDVRITQVVLNLLTNAVKYTEEGMVKLTIRTEERTEKEIRIYTEVRDTGIGIRQEDQEDLFTPFERLDEQRNHGKEGTGLGMSIVTGLLSLMGTELVVESMYGVGSAFSFVLTQGIVDGTPIGNVTGREKKVSRKKNHYIYAPQASVLLVDDNEMNRQVAGGFLELCGIKPDEAGSGEEALEFLRKKKYDLVFLDHMMPGMDGIETLQKMKEEGIAGEAVVIALTANAIAGAKDFYLQEGFSDYLSKPIIMDVLNEMLKKYLKTGHHH